MNIMDYSQSYSQLLTTASTSQVGYDDPALVTETSDQCCREGRNVIQNKKLSETKTVWFDH